MNKTKHGPSFNITLSQFLDSHLRTDFCAPISKKLADIIEVLSKGLLLCHVQRLDFEGNPLSQPILWRYKYWADSLEKYKLTKAQAEKSREQYFIFKHNLHILTEACEATMLLDEKKAKDIALSILSGKRQTLLKILEVELATSIDQIKE